MAEYDVLKVLSLATLLWLLFFLNLLLPKFIKATYYVDAMVWNILYVLLLASCLIVTMVVIGESIKAGRRNKVEQ